MSTILLDQFDALVDTPEAVERLRRLILDLAVRGRLVPQDPDDEPASVLLERVMAEKKRRFEIGEIRKPKPLAPVADDERPFELPEGWIWARLGNCVDVLDHLRKPISRKERERRNAGRPQSELYPYFGANQQSGWIDDYLFDEPLVLLGEDGAPFLDPLRGPSYMIDGKAWVNNHAHVLRSLATVDQYLSAALDVTDYSSFVSGTTRLKLNQAKMLRLPIPLPPEAEQRRIASRVHELLALCDGLADRLARRDALRQTWAASTVRHVSDDAPIGGAPAWAFAETHFDALLATPEAVPQVRRLVLDLAVRGRLTEQDPSTPARHRPVESLLSEKTRNGLSARLGDEPIGTPVLRISAGTSRSDFVVDETDFKYAEVDPAIVDQFTLRAGDLLACRFNGNLHYVGRFSIYEATSEEVRLFPDKLIRFRVDPAQAVARYVLYAMNSPQGRCNVEALCATTAGNIGVSATKLRKLSIPLPPVEEQRRIVARVDALMALCDRMEGSLRQRQEGAARLLEAALAGALA